MEYVEFENIIKQEFAQSDISITSKQIQKLYDYMVLLIEKNKVMNLTAITEPKEIIIRHFVDSCIFNRFYDLKEGLQILDMGTGAGFPGLPLAIINENQKFVLTDTLGKRINFLSEVLDKLKLKNVKLIKERAEDFGQELEYRESFDFVLSRGVAKISVLAEYSLPLVKIGGNMIAWKLVDCDTELNEGKKAIDVLGGMFHVKHQYNLLKDEPERCLLEINKIKITPKKYPRQAGMPSKRPI